jgi:hypothetical protein
MFNSTQVPALFRKIEPATPVVSLEKCEYNRRTRRLTLASEYLGMPGELFVKSHHTGREIKFVMVGESDELFDPDGWDGEKSVYRPVEQIPTVDHMVIYHLW